MYNRWFIVGLLLLAPVGQACADPGPPPPKEFADILRGMLLNNLPSPLVESTPGWGRQVGSLVGHKMRNQGAWRKVRVSAMSPDQTLTVDVGNLQQAAAGRTTFDLLVGFDAQIDFEQQMRQRAPPPSPPHSPPTPQPPLPP